MAICIRRAKAEDAEAIGRILYEVHAVHSAIRPDLFLPGRRKYDEAQVKELIQRTPVLVAEDEGDVLGYAVCFLQETEGGSMAAHKTLYLDDLCVDETSRKQGVGRRLFAAVEALAREQGCYDLTLNVWEGNDAARAFYDHLGMKPLKTYLEKVL